MECSSVDWGLKSRVVQLGTQILTSPEAARAKTPVVRYVVRNGCGCGKTSSRSLGPLQEHPMPRPDGQRSIKAICLSKGFYCCNETS